MLKFMSNDDATAMLIEGSAGYINYGYGCYTIPDNEASKKIRYLDTVAQQNNIARLDPIVGITSLPVIEEVFKKYFLDKTSANIKAKLLVHTILDYYRIPSMKSTNGSSANRLLLSHILNSIIIPAFASYVDRDTLSPYKKENRISFMIWLKELAALAIKSDEYIKMHRDNLIAESYDKKHDQSAGYAHDNRIIFDELYETACEISAHHLKVYIDTHLHIKHIIGYVSAPFALLLRMLKIDCTSNEYVSNGIYHCDSRNVDIRLFHDPICSTMGFDALREYISERYQKYPRIELAVAKISESKEETLLFPKNKYI